MNSKSVSELYVEEVKKKLKGNSAAIMVGAGFSRNADRIDKSSVHMPDWFELADIFCERLGIAKETSERYLDPIDLAQQVEELYGRAYLTELLREAMQDDNYQPSVVHRLLVELPWTDIFTTNYDTLLERAFETSMKRRYRVIYRQNDLIHSAGEPRIIKLHGSFPSYEPFIISEEDYRRYPVDFAPFVNTVQQALLENLFVLIGFSGSDPNFLRWIGWIHDNLGLKNSPRIYMIVHKKVSQVQAKMLSARSIDLIILNEIEAYRNGDYRESLRLFLSDLSGHIKTNGNGGGKKSWPGYYQGSFNKGTSDTLGELKRIHASYPGWITARYTSLGMASHLLLDCEFTIARIAKKEEKDPLEIEICKEFCWLCEITGSKYSVNILKDMDIIVMRHQTDSIDSEIDTHTYTMKRRNERNIEEWNGICYIEICMLRGYRLLGLDQWYGIYDRLKAKISVGDSWDELYAQFIYENTMQSLYSLKWNQLERNIRLIPADEEHPEWILRKASLLSLVGCYEESLSMLRDAIEDVRIALSRLNEERGVEYNRYSSVENSMISLYGYVLQAYESKTGKRWEKKDESTKNAGEDDYKIDEDNLTNYKDDFIWNLENNHFIYKLTGNYKPRLSESQTPTYDIGIVQNRTHFGGDIEADTAVQFISFRESIGHPFRIGYVTDKEGLKGAVSRVAWLRPKMALALVLLSPENKLIEDIFTRLLVANISIKDIDDCCRNMIDLMRFGMKSISERRRDSVFDTQIQETALNVIPELLSRFVVRCSDGIKEQMVDLLAEIYECEALDHGIKVCHLAKRLIECSSIDLLKSKMDAFWRISVKEVDQHLNNNFKDPFFYLYIRFSAKEEKMKVSSEQGKIFNEILLKCKDEKFSKNAITRLCYVFNLYSLSDKQLKSFKEVIWKEENLDSYGLPNLGEFFDIISLDFPHDLSDEAILLACKKSLLNEYQSVIKSKTITSFDNLLNKTLSLFERIEIDDDTALKISNVALEFCKLLSENIKPAISFDFADTKGDLFSIDEILGIALLKSGLAAKNKSVRLDVIDEVIDILDRNECPHPLLSWCVSKDNRYEEIMRCAFNVENGYSHCANKAMYQLIRQGLEVDDRIVSMMIDSIATTFSYTVNTYALGLENMIRNELLKEQDVRQIADSLERFDKITSLNLLDEDDEVMRKIAMRKVISVLAHTIYLFYQAKGKKVPMGVQYWKDKSEDPEEFAEIRMVWM